MSAQAIYRECSCSLIPIRPHIITSRAEWARHLVVKEQDRLRELFPDSSSEEPSPNNEDDSSVDEARNEEVESSVGACNFSDTSSSTGALRHTEHELQYSTDEGQPMVSIQSSPALGDSQDVERNTINSYSHPNPRLRGSRRRSESTQVPSVIPGLSRRRVAIRHPRDSEESSDDEFLSRFVRADNSYSQINQQANHSHGPYSLRLRSGQRNSQTWNGTMQDQDSSPDRLFRDDVSSSCSSERVIADDSSTNVSNSVASPRPEYEGNGHEGSMIGSQASHITASPSHHWIEAYGTDIQMQDMSNSPSVIEERPPRSNPRRHFSTISEHFNRHSLVLSIENSLTRNPSPTRTRSTDEENTSIRIDDPATEDEDESPFDNIILGNIMRLDMEKNDAEEVSSGSDNIGQMGRGFVSPISEGSQIGPTSTSEDDTSSTGEFANDGTFPYDDKIGKLTKQQIVSIALQDLKLSHRISRAAASDIKELLDSFADEKSWDYRTTKKWIEAETGVKPISYDCCINSCMGYAMYPDKEICDTCEHARWKTGDKKIPFATYEYIPIIHRLRLWYADSTRSNAMTSYRRQAQSEVNCTDYWNGELFRHMQVRKGLFKNITDVGFVFTTDGVQVYKAKTRFSIWPMALECLNLPPEIRTKRQNLLCTGFIPGPKGPTNLDSFLYPLIKEFEELQKGIPTINGAIPKSLITERTFILKGHICLIGADMVAREKVMKVTGNRSYCYCEYCLIRGIWHRGMYCPISPPEDAPLEVQSAVKSGYPWPEWDRNSLPMRNDREFRRVAKQMARKGATDQQKSKYGVKGLSILSQLSSIDFPRSFPPDSMHLWFENIVPDLVKHWRGKYRVENDRVATPIDGSDAGDASIEEEDTEEEFEEAPRGSRKRKVGGRKGSQKKGSQKKRKKSNVSKKRREPKVIATDDEYNISLQDWEKLSSQIAESAPNLPSLFGPLPRNFIEHIHQLTAAEWQLFTFLLAPIYLKDVLPDTDYEEFISLVEAIQIGCDHSLTQEDLIDMDRRIEQFSIYYEARYYRMELLRMKACLPVFHQILHVPQALRWAGPMYVYSQWAMERLCGTFSGMAKSRVSTNKNLSNTLVMLEQKNVLAYVLDYDPPESSDEDNDGNVRLSKFLAKRLKKIRPPDAAATRLNQEASENGSDSGSGNGNVVLFLGPSSFRPLSVYERACLASYLSNEPGPRQGNRKNPQVNTDYLRVPVYCRTFRGALFDTRERGDVYVFNATSSDMPRSNHTRSTSFVRYESSVHSGRHGFKESRFGKVLFFFTVQLDHESPLTLPYDPEITCRVREKERGINRDKHENEILLAFVRHFPVARDGRLLYKIEKGKLCVILASDIRELVGLLKKDKREYLVRKHTALFDEEDEYEED